MLMLPPLVFFLLFSFIAHVSCKAQSENNPNYFFQNNVIVTLSWNPPPPITSHLFFSSAGNEIWNLRHYVTCMMHVHRKKKSFLLKHSAKQRRLYRHFVGGQSIMWLTPSPSKRQNDVILEKIVWRRPLTRRLVIGFVTEFEFTQFAQWPYRLTCSVQKRPNPARVEQWGWSRVPSAL